MTKAKKAAAKSAQPEPAEQETKAPRDIAGKRRLLRELLTKESFEALYQVGPLLGREARERLGLTISSHAYVEDPTADLELEEVEVRWDPSVGDGPTSSRFVVVDYDADSGVVQSPAFWDAESFTFLESKDGRPVVTKDGKKTIATETPQFRQVHLWTKAQLLLEFCEIHLGRPIPWGFEGNRLMLVPAAGLKNNAFYDRSSKSLQLYFFRDAKTPGGLGYCSLAHDIVTHEAGHAVLDGIRPHFLRNSSWETAAFHEFFGDMVAILTTVRSNFARKYLDVDLKSENFLSGIARQFGEATRGRIFLRYAVNKMKFAEAAADREAHRASQVLTGAVFDVLARLAAQHLEEPRQGKRQKPATARQALAWAAQTIPSMALQPIDLLPPVDVRFADYLAAMLRNDEIVNPADENGYRPMIRSLFENERGIEPTPIELPNLDYFPNVDEASRSNAAAYRLVNDNRRSLGIPPNRDIIVSPPYDCLKRDSANNRLSRQIVIQYRWDEAIELPREPRFGAFGGQSVSLPCGGTLVFDDQNNLLSFMAKRGTDLLPTNPRLTGDRLQAQKAKFEAYAAAGRRRRDELVEHLADVISRRRLAFADDPAASLAFGHLDVLVRREAGLLHFESAPHLCGEEEPWTTSF